MKNLFYTILLFATTGAFAQTIVKNINPGAANSGPEPVGVIGGNLIFYADDGTHGYEPWVSDGTTSGTKMILDINPGLPLSVNYIIGALSNGKVYFSANDGSSGEELWATDGTAAGTSMIKNINTGGNALSGTQLIEYNGKIYFAANDGTTGNELWVTDGTLAGTMIVKNINPGGASSNPTKFTVALGKLFFSADDGTSGRELWKTDGTTINTVKVGDIGAGALNGDPGLGIEFQGFIYFAAVGVAADGNELWRSDGTSLEMVKNINPTAGASSNPGNFTVAGSVLYFTANDGSSGKELWKTDGTAVGTVIVKNINTGAADANPFLLGQLGSKLIFSATDPTTGTELWTSDGSSSGTTQVLDINTGVGVGFVLTSGEASGINTRSMPYSEFNNGFLYFAGNDGTNGTELWKTNGTAAGTMMVGQMNPSTGSSALDWVFIGNNKVWMRAGDGSSGQELFKYDIPVIGGVNYSLQNKNLNVYPNPSQNKITIGEIGYTTIYDMNGKLVESFENNGEAHDINNFTPGMYIINTISRDKLLSTRFVKN